MIFDPFYLLVIGSMALSLYASSITKGRFQEIQPIHDPFAFNRAQVAQGILQDNNIHDVRIERVAGELSDHYDPSSKTLDCIDKSSISPTVWQFLELLLHEVGHAIQHAKSYALLSFSVLHGYQ